MNDMREILRRGLGDYDPPTDGYERVLVRRDRRRRNQRMAAGAVGIGVFLLAALAFVRILDQEPSHPPARDPGETSSPDVARTDAWFIDLASGERTAGPAFGAVLSHVAVSPDGTRVAYVAPASSDREVVYVAGIDGSNVRAYPATRSPEGPKSPSWSPDGSTIVYQRKGIGLQVGELFLLDLASGEIRQLTDLHPTSDYYPLMSPTFGPGGDSVIFALPGAPGSAPWDLWSIAVTGGDPTLIRRDAGLVDASPEGTRISFVEMSIGGGGFTTGDLWIADADGSDAERVVDGQVSMSRWSPDGTRILYADEELDALRIVNVATGETIDVPSEADGSDWLDDGTLIVEFNG